MNNEKETRRVDEDVVVMGLDPLPDVTPDDIRAWYMHHHDEEGLVRAFAATWNEAFWVEDNEYDYEEGTSEHTEACAITDAWFQLMDELEREIFDILRSEGVEIPEKGRIVVFRPFMEKRGFIDRGGWWIRNG